MHPSKRFANKLLKTSLWPQQVWKLKVFPPDLHVSWGFSTPRAFSFASFYSLLPPHNKHDSSLFLLLNTTQREWWLAMSFADTGGGAGTHNCELILKMKRQRCKGKYCPQGNTARQKSISNLILRSNILKSCALDSEAPALAWTLSLLLSLHSSFWCFSKDLHYSSKVKFMKAIYKHKVCLF